MLKLEIKMDEEKLLLVVVMEGNRIRNSVLPLHGLLREEDILNLNILLNSTLNGLTVEEINLTMISKLKEQAGSHSKVVESVLDQIAEAVRTDAEELPIYTSGATNIFKYPELSDGEKASRLLSTFEQKDMLRELISDVNSSQEDAGTGIQVYIGNESPIQTMKDCSVVTATYELSEGVKGTVGIIGPKRMDYEKVMDSLKELKTQLDGILKKPST